MFKSVFVKYFSVVSSILLVSFFALSVVQTVLFSRAWVEDKRALLQENADIIARHTEVAATETQVGADGIVYQLDQNNLRPFLGLYAAAIDSTIFITNSEGEILLCSDSDYSGQVDAELLNIVKSGSDFYERGTLNGLFTSQQYIAGASIEIRETVVGFVFASSPADALIQAIRNNLKIHLLAAFLTLLVAMIAVYLLAFRFVRPLRMMAAATRRFAQGDFSARVNVKGNDEVAELADALNHMATSLSSVETMRRSFVANVSHELKTPMTTIAGFVDGILDGTIPPEKQSHYMRIVSDEVKRLSRLVRSMLDLSRIDSGELKMTAVRMDLTEALLAVLVSSEQRIEKKNLTVTGLDACEKMEISGDYDLMSQVLYNLLDNAIKFTNEGGEIAVAMKKEEDRVCVAIRNTGDGIPADEMPQIFERFYKSDRSRGLDRNGLGLGLYIVKTVIGLHQGEITVRSVEGQFTEFSFWIPVAPETNELVQ